jgi:hypothetical protein
MIFPIPKSCYKLIDFVYSSGGIKISRLLKEVSVSQRIGYKHIDDLIKIGVFNEDCIGSLRILKPNLSSEVGQLIYGLIEKQREIDLLINKPELKEAIVKLRGGVESLNINSVVIYGSFIKEFNSDNIDILVISESNDKRIIPFLQDCFSSIKNAVSARIMSCDGFIRFKQSKNDLFNSLFSNHVCVFNSTEFLRLAK